LCILRLSAIGDVTHMVPVIHTVRQAWPQCAVTWIIGKLEASLVSDLPGVEFIIFDKAKGSTAFLELRRQLRGRRFDVLLDMQVAMRANLISLLVNAPLKLGFDRARAHDLQWLFTNRRIPAQTRPHVLDGFFAFTETLGIAERSLRWNLPVPPEATAFADKALPPEREWLAINPCSSARLLNWRNWPAQNYARVAQYAATRYDLGIVLTGGPAELERATAQAIRAAAPGIDIVDLVGRTSLKQLLAVLGRSNVLISPDTGPAHIATAADTPVIGLYAASNPLRTGPYLSQQYVIDKYPEALRKYNGKSVDEVRWGQRVRHPDAMRLITVDEVIAMLDRVMADSATAR
jgi:heptosyltransferase I